MDEAVLPVLRRFCHVLITTLTSDPLLALYQLVIGEARRFPHLAQTFYERGPRRGKARLAVWMAEKMARGELRRGDPLQAVYHLARSEGSRVGKECVSPFESRGWPCN